jgi:hypothetical protein
MEFDSLNLGSRLTLRLFSATRNLRVVLTLRRVVKTRQQFHILFVRLGWRTGRRILRCEANSLSPVIFTGLW